MNGHTLTGATRAFYVYDGVRLKIQDTSTEKTGVVRGYGGNTGTSFGGGTIFNKKEGIIDFYSGTITLCASGKRLRFDRQLHLLSHSCQ